MESYKFLEQLFSKINSVECILSKLSEQHTFYDNEEVIVLEEIKHEMISHDLVKDMLQDALSNKRKLNEWQRSSLCHMSKLYKHNSILPFQLIRKLTEAKLQCKRLWKSAHQEDNFSSVLPHFSELVELTREAASIKSDSFECSKYDTLLDFYDSSIKEKDLDKIFTKIGKFFHEHVWNIVQNQNKNKIFHIKNAPIEKQKLLNCAYLDAIGLTTNNDNSTSADNIMAFIDYDKSNLYSSLFAVLRNSGDILYEKYLSQDLQNQQIGKEQIFYESQSMLMEKNLGTSLAFVDFIQPNIKKVFPTSERATSAENIYHFLNKVCPNPLLKNADEVTFPAHIMLRYTIEKEIISGNLQVKDLHDAWLEGIKHYFDCVPEKESEKYFQDDYWVSGIFGYFPLKAIAAIAATQIFSVIIDKNHEVLTNISKGDFNPFVNWLNVNIHKHGAEYTISQLLKKITNKNLNVDCYIDYLSNKYLQ